MRSVVPYHDGLRSHEKSVVSKRVGFHKKILAGTSKNRANEKNEGIGKYDIREIHSIFTSMYDNYDELVYCICTKDTKRLEKKIQNCEECNDDIKKYLQCDTTIIIDWNDLNQSYHQFKMNFGNKSLDKIINSNKTTLCLKMHQLLGVRKSLRLKNDGIMKHSSYENYQSLQVEKTISL